MVETELGLGLMDWFQSRCLHTLPGLCDGCGIDGLLFGGYCRIQGSFVLLPTLPPFLASAWIPLQLADNTNL